MISLIDLGFLVVSIDNITFVTKYCTIVDGIFRIHKSRLSEQTEQELCLNRCTLSFPEERTRDIQFALIDEQTGTIFIRGNNIYSMGRLLNTLAKYVEITGSSQFVFTGSASGHSTPITKRRRLPTNSSQPHIYSDVDASSSITNTPRSNGKHYIQKRKIILERKKKKKSSLQNRDPSVQSDWHKSNWYSVAQDTGPAAPSPQSSIWTEHQMLPRIKLT